MENLEIYNKYKSVPENALKPFDNGKFKGTDINTMWRVKCLTEQFGVIGFGWTIKVLRTWTEQGANDEILAFAEIEMKVKINDEWSEPFTATGGNLMTRYVKGKNGNLGYYSNNDEAFKMAITDAFGVACKYLGFGADVYWENDRTKYTNTDNTGSNSSESNLNEQTPASTKQTQEMTIEQALNHICEINGLTINDIYKDKELRGTVPELYKMCGTKTKRAFTIVNEYIALSKNESKN
jgi:hypothetical protein